MKQSKPSLYALVLSGILESAAVMLWATQSSPIAGTWMHGAAVLALFVGIIQSRFTIRGPQARLLTGLSLLPGMIPVFGPFLYLTLIAIWGRPSENAETTSFIGHEDVYHGDELAAPASEEQSDILSIVRSSSVEKRRRAILGVRSYEPIAAVPVLQRCLQDSDELVRIYAQGILQNLIEKLEGRVRTIQAKLEDNEDTDLQVQLEFELAEVLHELVYTGIESDAVARSNITRKAFHAIERAIKLAPQRQDLRYLRLRYLLELREVDAAEAQLTELQENGFDNYQLLSRRCELAYLKRDWQALKKLCATTLDSGMAHGRLLSTCDIWKGRDQ